jgi:hypothetical protein
MRLARIAIFGLLCLVTFERCVQADVGSFTASSSSSIVQYQGGVEQQRQDLYKDYPAGGTGLPVEVSHTLVGRDSSDQVSWTAFNRVLTNDPQYNSNIPTDFITETAIGSAASDVTLNVSSHARQNRHINLLSSEFPGLANGTAVTLKSAFTLDGALAAVVPTTASSAQGLQIKCNLNITKDSSSIWNGSVEMTGKADGTFDVTTSGDFHDNDFVVAQNEVPDLAKIWIVAFGDKELPFSYEGIVGESFDLAANLNFEYVVPGGLGAGSAFGTVPSEMINVTREIFGAQADPYTIAGASPMAAPEPASLLIFLAGMAFVGLRKQKS